MGKMSPEHIADEIMNAYLDRGKEIYFGESITQIEHACQAAAFAINDGQDSEIILAAFLHDYGHLIDNTPENQMDTFGVKNHEAIGAQKLAEFGFSESVIILVNSHVEAKRYLCFANKRYFENLSEASKRTLEFQGGPMTQQEAKLFEENPLKNLIIKMRTWDEAAKQENIPLPDLNSFRRLIVAHLNR